MKIKSINDFTLTECQEYLDANPSGELAPEVTQRLEYLKQLQDRKLQQDNIRKINEFNTEFNRNYATQQYEKAFSICLKYISDINNKKDIIEKAESVIPKLRNCIQIPSSITFSYDRLIDLLVLNGYNKMKYNENSLKLNKSLVKVQTKGKLLEITSRSRINPFFIFILTIIMVAITGLIIPLFAYPIGYSIYGDLYEWSWKYESSGHFEEMLGIGILFAFCFLIFWLSLFFDILYKQPKVLLRKIAHIIVDNLTK